MPPRPLLSRVLVTAALALMPAAEPAWAQQTDALGLRGDFDSGFPTSPSAAPTYPPEDNSPPAPPVAPAEVDQPRSGADLEPVTPPPSDEDQTGPNYGKPRKKKSKLYKPDIKVSPPLPALVPYRGAPGYRRVLNPAPPPKDAVDPLQPGTTIAVIPSPLRVKKPIPELDPYLPTGIQVGEMRLLPYVEGSTGYETNPNQVTTGAKASPVLRAEGGLDLQSDFSQHSLTASLRGGYSDFPANPNANRPDANGVVDGRIDVTRNDQIITEARFTIATQTPGSPLLAVPTSVFITNRPTIIEEGATLGGTHTFNRLSLSLKGTFDRTEYGNAEQSNGTPFLFSQDNYDDYGVVARAAYELTPSLAPFVEAGFDSRVRDNPVDQSGYYRDSTGITGRAGANVDFTSLLTGTISAGYADRHYADPRLQDLHGPTVDGALAYAVTPLTTVKFTAGTSFSETTLSGASGAISRVLSLELDHQLFRNFTLSGVATYQPNEYQGIVVHEDLTSFTLKGAYSLSRDVQLIASASRQDLSTTLGDGFIDYIFLTGVRLQR